MKKFRIAAPGPGQVPHDLLLASAKELIHHRSPQMEEVVHHNHRRLQEIFRTSNPVYSLLASGTGAMEAAITNFFSVGDTVVVVCNGYWGDRFAAIADVYGLNVERVEAPWGQGIDPHAVEAALNRHPAAKGLLVCYSETSTGVLNPVRELAALCAHRDTIVVVDAIGGLITHPLAADDWALDVVLGVSHKGFMLSPGLAFLAVSPKAWALAQKASSPNFYFSLKRIAKSHPLSPNSPAISLIQGLRAAVDLITHEGVGQIAIRHARVARAVNHMLEALGFENLVQAPHRRNSIVTVARPPAGVSAAELLALLKLEFGLFIPGGQDRLKGQVIRFGHLGPLDAIDLHGFGGALEAALLRLGHSVERGAASVALHAALSEGLTEADLRALA